LGADLDAENRALASGVERIGARVALISIEIPSPSESGFIGRSGKFVPVREPVPVGVRGRRIDGKI
jgi:hypothetical protein